MTVKSDSVKHRASISRRQFIRRTGAGACAALTSTPLLSSLLTLGTTGAMAAQGGTEGYKALVCVFLGGGNDSFNMLTPFEKDEYNDYAAVRNDLALSRSSLLQVADTGGRNFGIHPGMGEVRQLYKQGKLCFLANVGSLVEPTDLYSYENRQNLPVGLFSHSDQERNWHSAIPQSRVQVSGWAGRMADALTDSSNYNPTISMNIALNNLNLFQTGVTVTPYVINEDGATTLSGYQGRGNRGRILTNITDSLLNQNYSDPLKMKHAALGASSINAAVEFNFALDTVGMRTRFPATGLGAKLAVVARAIAARQALAQTRQVFFVEMNGWDHHDDLLNQQALMLPELSAALKAFYNATEELGVAGDVTTFTASDFGRTLTSNGAGSDHGWGGNQIIMGGSVAGGQVYGQYPESLAQGNPLDTGRGRLIPTTSVDEYNAELARWFGIPNDSGLEIILPNIRNFYPSGSDEPPIGFMV